MPEQRPYTKTEQVLTTVTASVRERLDAYAARREMSRAEAMRVFIARGLAEADAEGRS